MPTPNLQLDALQHNLEQLRGKIIVEAQGLSAHEEKLLAILKSQDRDFFQWTKTLEAAAMRYAKAGIEKAIMSGRKLTKQQILDEAAEGIGKQILLRFSGTGNDLSMPPLSSAYIARKRSLGLSTAIGVAYGDLKKALTKAKWVIK